MSIAVDETDYFSDYSVLRDPSNYFEALRQKGPASWIKNGEILAVVGFNEVLSVLQNDEVFSPVNSSPSACLQPLPFAPEGDDITEQLNAHRQEFPHWNIMTSLEGESHAANRSLINSFFTPTRLKANEEYMTGLSKKLVAEVAAKGGCDIINELSVPFVTLVIADLLGVPDGDRQKFREVVNASPRPGAMNVDPTKESVDPMTFMGQYFYQYLQSRRENPQDDILSELANKKYPDGSTPELLDLVTAAIFVFGAGGDTTTKLIGSAILYLVQDLELQKTLRADRSLIPVFLEEILRLEGATKVLFRMAKKTTEIGGIAVPAGTRIMVSIFAANRDPERWGENAGEFQFKRPKVMQHLSFSRGTHTCIGNPLARTEGRVMLNQLFDQTEEIVLDESVHGALGEHELGYEASFLLRGLESLAVKFK